ncbi:cupin domain-containing protein [Roseomonas elaeocarpi]|uniref:Cupin domain-containing protein n=1 Tax=Roseomonas elaeocarpi TaxID=907779 RepID=A0ABV6JPP5_9PROT
MSRGDSGEAAGPRFGRIGDQPLPEAAGERFETLLAGGGARVVAIASRDHADPPGRWYEQHEAEFVLVVSGEARLRFADGAVKDLTAGDWVVLPPRCRHRVERTGAATRWLAVHLPVSPEPERAADPAPC